MKNQTTQAHAEEARAAVAKMFQKYSTYPTQPIVQEPGHWSERDTECWYVCWEEGPEDWALKVPYAMVPGLFLEPYNSFVLAVTTED
jgi:hypothetical protein